MKLGSLAVWWSPLIIVCPDPVYLSKLFLVWQKGPAQALSNKKARARGQLSAGGCRSWWGGVGRHAASPWAGALDGRSSRVPWRETFLRAGVGCPEWSPRPAAILFIISQMLFEQKRWVVSQGVGWRGERSSNPFLKCLLSLSQTAVKESKDQLVRLVCLSCWLISESMGWVGSWSSWTFIILGPSVQ